MEDGDEIILDAENGHITINVPKETLEKENYYGKSEKLTLIQEHFGNTAKLLGLHLMEP